MKMRLFIFAAGLFCLFSLAACSDDNPVRTKKVIDPWPDLKEKDDVFEYLEMVYENMNIDRYPKLLDDNFIFWFSPADYNDGLTPEMWGRTQELASARNMFSNYAHPQYGAITAIDVQLVPEGLWIEVPKTEPPYAGETWYQKTAEYSIIMKTTSEWTLQGMERKALFTVRQVEVEGETIWRIVLWHDDIQ